MSDETKVQEAQDLPTYDANKWAERMANDWLVFVARGQAGVNDGLGNGIGVGEWRLSVVREFLDGPAALLGISLPWVDDIAESAGAKASIGGVAMDADCLEALGKAALRTAEMMRRGEWNDER